MPEPEALARIDIDRQTEVAGRNRRFAHGNGAIGYPGVLSTC
jgi:hypothetical protein